MNVSGRGSRGVRAGGSGRGHMPQLPRPGAPGQCRPAAGDRPGWGTGLPVPRPGSSRSVEQAAPGSGRGLRTPPGTPREEDTPLRGLRPPLLPGATPGAQLRATAGATPAPTPGRQQRPQATEGRQSHPVPRAGCFSAVPGTEPGQAKLTGAVQQDALKLTPAFPLALRPPPVPRGRGGGQSQFDSEESNMLGGGHCPGRRRCAPGSSWSRRQGRTRAARLPQGPRAPDSTALSSHPSGSHCCRLTLRRGTWSEPTAGWPFLQDICPGPSLSWSMSGRPGLHRAGLASVWRVEGALRGSWLLVRPAGRRSRSQKQPGKQGRGPGAGGLSRPSGPQSVFERQGIAVMTPTVPGSPKGPFLGLPRGTMRRQKSIGITEEERQFLAPPMLKFTRSLSMPDTSEDIPPPPQAVPPSPPPPSPTAYNCPKSPTPRVYGTIKPAFNQNAAAKVSPAPRSDTVATMVREKGLYYRRELDRYSLDSEDLYSRAAAAAQGTFRGKRGQMPENPYSEVGKIASKAVYVPAKPARRKGMLVKQSNVEDSPEKTCAIAIPTIIVKEPSTSSSGKSSQASSMEIDPQASEQPGQLRPDDSLTVSSPFAAAIAGAVRDREKRLEARRNSPAFLSTDLGDEDVGLGPPAPRARPSTFPEEAEFGEEDGAEPLASPTPAAAPREAENHFAGGGEAGAQGEAGRPLNPTSKAKGPEGSPAVPPKSSSTAGPENYVHPLTGRLLDPSSPLALALSARDRAMKESQQGPRGEAPKADLNKPLYIDTKMRPCTEAGFPPVTRQNTRGPLRRQETENKYETDRKDDKKGTLISIVDASQQKSAGLLMVHTVDAARPDDFLEEEDEKADEETEPDHLPSEVPEGVPETEGALPMPAGPEPAATAPSRTVTAAGSVEEAAILPFRIPPPPLASVDLDEDFIFTEPLPPPLEFANSFEIPDDRAAPVPVPTDLAKQEKNDASQSPSLPSSQPANSADAKKPAGLSNCLPASFLPPPESFDAVTDSGIEEVDSRSSSDHHLETTSTISTVSSISTLSSEGGENADTCTVYADGQAFMVDKPPVPPKPKMKPIVHKGNALFQDALLEEDVGSFVIPPPAPPPPPGAVQPGTTKVIQPRTSKLWGDVSEIKSPILSGPKANVISELNSILQQMNREKSAKPGAGLDLPTGTKPASLAPRGPEVMSSVSGSRSTTVTFTVRPGTSQPITLQSRPPDYESRTSGTRRAPSPVVSPTELSKEMLPAPLSAAAASPSPALSDVFGLPSQPPAGDLFGLNPAGRSRSPSPSILQQPISNKPFTAKPVHLWTKPDVADWLESLNLGEHKEAFMDNEIDGSHLPNLQKEDLIDLGVTRVGHRMNIERALKQLLDR
uniref:SH3 and multiple ankyrin repeat domains 2 n=2 Tax=Sus scrofa TaxID=9823 RepID=A0A8D1YFQ5_PIG